MRFTDPPQAEQADDASADDDPAVMHIGGSSRGRRLRSAAAWAVGVAALAAVLVGFFVWFGATVGWAIVLVALMVSYMAAMARWTGNDR